MSDTQTETETETPVRIVAAAIYYGAVISLPAPARHHTILASMTLLMDLDALEGGEKQGFITSEGKYVNRVEAYYIAQRAGQLKNHNGDVPQLFSEDLW